MTRSATVLSTFSALWLLTASCAYLPPAHPEELSCKDGWRGLAHFIKYEGALSAEAIKAEPRECSRRIRESMLKAPTLPRSCDALTYKTADPELREIVSRLTDGSGYGPIEKHENDPLLDVLGESLGEYWALMAIKCARASAATHP